MKSFEFGSFVHPKRVPQMANSGELFNELADEDVDLIALVPNLKGAERAKEVGVERINFVFSASDTHNMQNVQKTTAESIEELKQINAFCERNEMCECNNCNYIRLPVRRRDSKETDTRDY